MDFDDEMRVTIETEESELDFINYSDRLHSQELQ